MTEGLSEEQKRKQIEMLEAWDSMRRAVKFLVVLGNFIKWAAVVGAGIASIIATSHGHKGG